MFALLIGVGALFLAVFVSAILDPRRSHTGGASERTRADDGSDYVVDDLMLRQRAARCWRWGSLIASRTTSRGVLLTPPLPCRGTILPAI